jgi:uncharacterized membrane protein
MIDWHADHESGRSFGQRAADAVARFGGSWGFVGAFGLVIVVWMAFNVWTYVDLPRDTFDPYPFILLNLVLSCLAAVQAPIIMMSQNRQNERDRMQSRADYLVDTRSLEIIERIAAKLDVDVPPMPRDS